MQDLMFYKNIDKKFNLSQEEFRRAYSDLQESIDVFGYVVNGIWQEKIKDLDWRYYSETLAKKYLVQSSTLLKLLLGTEVKLNTLKKNIILIDVTSVYITMRALIGNYLILHYLYFEDIPDEERRMRWIIYQLSGIKSRRSVTDDNFIYEKKTVLLEKEKNQENDLMKELSLNSYYQKLPKRTQEYIHKNKLAKVKNWAEIITSSKLNKSYFHRIWKLYSNYAHSEYLSVL